jgi:hypothetical protein
MPTRAVHPPPLSHAIPAHLRASVAALKGLAEGGRVEPIGRDFEGSPITVSTEAEDVPSLWAALMARSWRGEVFTSW